MGRSPLGRAMNSVESGPQHQGTGKPRRRRLRRILGWSAVVSLGLILIAVAVLFLLLANLDNPKLAAWLQSTLKDDYGVTLGYDRLSIAPFSGMEAGGVQIQTPEPYAAHAPELLEIGEVDVTWDFWPLIGGTPRLPNVEIRGLTLVVVIDEKGNTSIDKLVADMDAATAVPRPEPAKKKPKKPDLFSHLLKDALPDLTIASLSISDAAIEIIEIDKGRVSRRVRLGDLCGTGKMASAPGALSTDMRIAPCAQDRGAKIAIEVSPGTPDAVRGDLFTTLVATMRTPEPTTIELDLDADLIRQNVLPRARLPKKLLRAKASMTFEPEAGRTAVRMSAFDLLDGILTSDLVADVRDRPNGDLAPVIERAVGGFAAERLVDTLPDLFEGIALQRAAFEYEITDLAVNPESGVITSGDVQLRGDIASVEVAQDGQTMTLDEGTIRTRAHPR